MTEPDRPELLSDGNPQIPEGDRLGSDVASATGEDEVMDPADLHARAQQIFADVLVDVTDGDLAEPTPCTDWSVADLIDHVVDGNAMVVRHMGGEEVRLPDADRSTVHRAAADRAIDAFSAPGWSDRFVELPFGSIPAPVFATIRAGDLYAHAWDLARAIGATTDLDRDLGDAIFAATAPVLSPDLRGAGRPFGVEQPCSSDRPIADRYAAFLGRSV